MSARFTTLYCCCDKCIEKPMTQRHYLKIGKSGLVVHLLDDAASHFFQLRPPGKTLLLQWLVKPESLL